MSRIVVSGRLPEPARAVLTEAFPGEVWMHPDDTEPTGDVLATELADAEGFVAVWMPVQAGLLDCAPKLRIVANTAVGYDNVDVAECTARGIQVTNTPGVLTDATADVAFGLLLAVTRRLAEGDRLIRSGSFPLGFGQMLGAGLQARRLGVVGMGAIGRAVAHRGRAFGMQIVYHNRAPVAAEHEAALGAHWVALEELLETSDVVSLNCPYTPATHHLVDAAALARMQPTAYLVNTARGKIVDEPALVDALRAGQLAGAALDVFEDEPRVHPGLLELDNVVLAPHVGSATVETRTAMAVLAARNVVAVLRGEPPLTPVNTLSR
jgi:glyoxylate reductase